MGAGEPDSGLTVPSDAAGQEGDLVCRLRRALAEADARMEAQERELEQWRSGGPEQYRRHRAKMKARLEEAMEERQALEREVSVLRRHLRQLTRTTEAVPEPEES